MSSYKEKLKAAVVELQQTLNAKHGAGLVADGDAGLKTVRAVQNVLAEAPAGFEVIPRELPNFCYSTRALENPCGVMLHYTSAYFVARESWDDPETIFKLIIDLNLPKAARRNFPLDSIGGDRIYASYHYLIARDGVTFSLVPENRKAYHAGRGVFGDWKQNYGNAKSIGVALVAYGRKETGKISGYTEPQYEALTKLLTDIKSRHEIKDICGHDEYAPERKSDPGEAFDWSRVR